MSKMPSNYVDLVVTSPPYDNLRDYKGYSFEFEKIAKELYRVVKDGGVVVWVVSDGTVNGSETGTSFKQALYFKEIGFNIHDTMIWQKPSFNSVGDLQTRYAPVFEYMFVFSKGKPKAFNPIKDKKNINFGVKMHGTKRLANGDFKPISSNNKMITEYGVRYNIWQINAEMTNNNRLHPAVFPEQLAYDHIISWSNENDIVYDPFTGSGTTCKMAHYSRRNYIGSEISKEYCEIAEQRLLNSVVGLV
jgi:DNA modification methylase